MGERAVARWSAGAVVAGVGLLAATWHGAAGAQEAPISFDESTFTVPADGEHDLTLLNNTTTPLRIQVRVGPGDDLTAAASTGTIAAGGTAEVTVASHGARAGTQASVVAVATPDGRPGGGGGGVARATFAVGGSTAAAEPLVSDWSVTSYRFVPWGDDADNAVLPLRDATSCDDVRLPEGTVGGVSASPGSARVVATCREDGAPGADVGAELAFPGLAHHTGDYAGSIDLAPGDDGAGAVALTVRRTDYVLVPLAVLLLGVGAALLAARQTGRIDALSADERDAWLLVARVDQAHRDFRAKAVDTSWAAYSFKADADERVRATMRELHRLGSGFSRLRKHDPDYASARAALEPVATAAAAWPLLADRLVELDVAIAEVGLKASTHRPPTHASNEPACTAAARPLLAGRRLTVDDAVARAGAVDGAATLTGGWLEWAATVGQMESRAQLLALAVDELPEGHHDREALAEATAKVSAARVALWEVEDLAGLRERQVIEGIADARLLLDGLNHHFRDDVREVDGDAALPAEQPEPAVPVLTPTPLGEALETGGRSPADEASRADARRRWRTGVAVAVTGSVAVWSGLSALYFDRAFGTPRDYVGIFVWGFAAQAVLAALAVGLDRLVAARRPAT